MSRANPRDLLRWYPRAWRERYGEELLALVEDFSEDGRLRLRDRLDLLRVGLLLHRGDGLRHNRRRIVSLRLFACATALVATGLVTVDAAAVVRDSGPITSHQAVVVGERGAAVISLGGAAAIALHLRRPR